MKPLITTVAALREVATGISPESIASSLRLFEHETQAASFLLSVDDDSHSQRVVVMRDGNLSERFVPENLSGSRREVVSRMASFAERARSQPFSLPRGWNQFKRDNFITFFAMPGSDPQSTRWIAEALSGPTSDVVFWATSTSTHKADLDSFVAAIDRHVPDFESEWETVLVESQKSFSDARRPTQEVAEMYLPVLPIGPAKRWTYEEWLQVISEDQKEFIDAPTDKSIRLRGPAGSGKSLAIMLKAVREILDAQRAGDSIRVLIVTHSWSLAAQISDSIDLMGLGMLSELEVFPLLEIAQELLPRDQHAPPGYSLIGEDSYSGKRAQLDQILEVIQDFAEGDWVTFRSDVSTELRDRMDSPDDNVRLAFAWDLLVEFGSVIGAAGIFPGAGSDQRYFQLTRARWMLPLTARKDLEVVFALYARFMENLEERSLVTPDQVVADLLSFLETHAWNRLRKDRGYDLIFVDEFHLFSPLERQVLNYLSRDVQRYPRLFMAVDPRQSPSEAFIGIASDETRSSAGAPPVDDIGDVTNLELTTVHRFTPQILSLVKHVHYTFPALELGDDWNVDFSRVESARADGPKPRLVVAASREGEETDLYKAVDELYNSGRIALAIVDMRQWRTFSDLASRLQNSGRFHVSAIAGRSDIEGLGYRRRGLVVGSAEYLAGLQFDTVLVAGVPDLNPAHTPLNDRTRILSLLYLALSRAEREVRVFANDDDGGPPEILKQAVAHGRMDQQRGSQT